MVILVQRSRRPRRWAGVAMFATMLIAVWCLEHREITPSGAIDVSIADAPAHDSFESVLQRAPVSAFDHTAQLAELALNSSSNTESGVLAR